MIPQKINLFLFIFSAAGRRRDGEKAIEIFFIIIKKAQLPLLVYCICSVVDFEGLLSCTAGSSFLLLLLSSDFETICHFCCFCVLLMFLSTATWLEQVARVGWWWWWGMKGIGKGGLKFSRRVESPVHFWRKGTTRTLLLHANWAQMVVVVSYSYFFFWE